MQDTLFLNVLFGSCSLKADSYPMEIKYEGRGFPFESSNYLCSIKKYILFGVEPENLR